MYESPNNGKETEEEGEEEQIFPITEQTEAEFRMLKAEYLEKKSILEKIRNGDECVQGGSSFYDISGNLLSVVGFALRTYEYTHDPKAVRELSQNLGYIDRYLKFLDSDEKVRRAELTQRDGAFPEARQAADRAKENGQTQRPIVFYIESITPSAEEEKGETVVN